VKQGSIRAVLGAAAVLLILTVASAMAQPPTGTIQGRITGAQGAAVSGAVVTLVGPGSETTRTTDTEGHFRFPGLEPGSYELRVTAQGFAARTEPGLEMTLGNTIDLKVGLDGRGPAQAVAQAGAATDTTLSQSLLFNMPISRANPAMGLLNYAPAINSGSAFGGAAGTANALLVDGVDVRDPEGGIPWVSLNYNVIDQVQIGSLGQAAEFGGFSGAVINMVTRSGGNRFAGLFEHRYSSRSLRGDNIKDRKLNNTLISSLNPALEATGIDRLNDLTVQMSGPVKANRAFFFGSVQRYSIKEDPEGPRTVRSEVTPRLNGKLTLQPSDANNVVFSFQYENYDQHGLTGLGDAAGTTDFSSIEQASPRWVYRGQYRRVLGNSAVLEAAATGYWSHLGLTPLNPVPAILNGDTGAWLGGAGYSARFDRTRNQLNASLSKYAEAKGTHAFKFGIEIERSTVRNQSAYTDGLYFVEYGDVPYYAYSYSYDVKGRNERYSAFAQDRWQVGRLTVNAGVRFDSIKGVGANSDAFYSASPIAPRVGMAYDVFGDGKSVLRAYYGQLYDGAIFTSWSRALPGVGDYVGYLVSGNYTNYTLTEDFRVSGASRFTLLDDIKHPRTDEFSVAYERELARGVKATGAYVRRDARNFINATVIGATWQAVLFTNPLTGQQETIYRLAGGTNVNNLRFQIGNVDNFAYNGAPPANAYRTYDGAMFVLQRALMNRWQARVSYVYSTTKGTVTNSGFAGVSSSQFLTPNLVHFNADGFVDNDRTHQVKVFAGYQIPVAEVNVNVFYRGLSGPAWAPFARVPATNFRWITSLDLSLEPRGNRRTKFQHIVDLRLEKVFNVRDNRFGLYMDAENLLNSVFPTSVQTRYPSGGVNYVNAQGLPASATVLLGSPLTLNAARQITFGGRWSF
jgi:hypothetical protein